MWKNALDKDIAVMTQFYNYANTLIRQMEIFINIFDQNMYLFFSADEQHTC